MKQLSGFFLLRWIGNLFEGETAADQRRNDPTLTSAVEQSARIYSQIPLHQFIDEKRRSILARQLFLEVNDLGRSPDPAARCRERYTAAMLKLAAYQVLMIAPPPEEDHFGLREQPGITGELRQHLAALFESVDELRSALFENDDEQKPDLWEFVQRQFWESHWRLETLNVARKALANTDKADAPDRRDWSWAFLHAASVHYEHLYRWELQLPSAFDASIAKEAATAYSVFTDIVLSGADDPAAEWRAYYEKSGIPMPKLS